MKAQNHARNAVLVSIILMIFAGACSRTGTFTPRWLLIKWFHGELVPGHQSDVRVYVAQYLSGENQGVTYLQNRFEVATDGKSTEYLWPDSQTFSAGWCEIVDLDGDGIREFMIGSDRIIRVVRFDGKSMIFRPKEDEVSSINYTIGPFDLKHNGGFEFVADDPIASGAINVSIPRVKEWSFKVGFTDVSKQYKNYYTEVVIPDFKKHLDNAHSSEERDAYERALKAVEQILTGS